MVSVLVNRLFSYFEIKSSEAGCKVQGCLECQGTKQTFSASQRTWPGSVLWRKLVTAWRMTHLCASPHHPNGFCTLSWYHGSSWPQTPCGNVGGVYKWHLLTRLWFHFDAATLLSYTLVHSVLCCCKLLILSLGRTSSGAWAEQTRS